MSGNCLNCGEETDGPFCATCGQRRQAERLTLRGVVHDAWEHWLNLDAPLVATFVGLWRDPGGTARAYVEGARVRYTNPFKYGVLTFAVTYAAGQWFGTSTIPMPAAPDPKVPAEIAQAIVRFQDRLLLVEPYTAILHFVLMPILGLYLRALFPSSGRTWVEFYCLALYVSAQAFLVELVATPFGDTAIWWAQLAPAALLAWGAGRFAGARWWTAALRAVVALVAFMLTTGVLVAGLTALSFLVVP